MLCFQTPPPSHPVARIVIWSVTRVRHGLWKRPDTRSYIYNISYVSWSVAQVRHELRKRPDTPPISSIYGGPSKEAGGESLRMCPFWCRTALGCTARSSIIQCFASYCLQTALLPVCWCRAIDAEADVSGVGGVGGVDLKVCRRRGE